MRLNKCTSRPSAVTCTSYLYGALYFASLASSTSLSGELPISQDLPIDLGIAESDGAPAYEPAFGLFDKSIAGRANLGLASLQNNKPTSMNLEPGSIACYKLEGKKLLGKSGSRPKPGKRAALNARDDGDDGDDDDEFGGTTEDTEWSNLYLSATTCRQPRSKQKDRPTAQPGQLTLALFDSKDGGCTEKKIKDVSEEDKIEFEEGLAVLLVDPTKDVYVGIAAPDIDKTKFDDEPYNFEVAASIDTFYHGYSPSIFQGFNELLWMDSDSSSALLVTRNLTQSPDEVESMMQGTPPYVLFAENDARNLTGGLRASFCGLNNTAQILSNPQGDGMQHDLCRTSMTLRGPGGMPKQQFFFENLNVSSSYTGILFQPPSTNGSRKRQWDDFARPAGGTIFPPLTFQTTDSNSKTCRLMEGDEFDFCDEIQWGVPGNDDLNKTQLAKKYDDYAREIYENFEKVMMQIPCEAPPDQAYSLARSCDDCKRAYKKWLCTVSIPRCEGIFSSNPFAIPRNIGQPFPNGTKLAQAAQDSFAADMKYSAARNKDLNDDIKPGPYKEILPCDDVCYEVVQACPAALQLACPLPGMIGFEGSYEQRPEDGSTNPLRCNAPGASRTRQSTAGNLGVPRSLLALVPVGILILSI